MIEQGLYTLLAATSTIAAMVGTRIYPLILPEASVLPALTYQVVGGHSSATFDTAGMTRLRMQFDCWGADYLDAITLRVALIAALNGYQGLLSDGTNLQNAQQLQNVDFFDHEARYYRAMTEFYLYFD